MSSPFTPIQNGNKTLAAHVYERIREAILTGTLQAGTRVDQNQVAAWLNVSLAPVREALKELEAEGFVTIFPRRGAFVTQTSITDLDELYDARSLIEGETIYRAVPHLTDKDLSDLQQMIHQMKQVSANGDVNAYIVLNREFHLNIYKAAGNQTLLQVIRNLWERSELYRYRYMFTTHNPERVHREHQAILDACSRRDPAGAREAAVHHIQLTQQELHELLRADSSRAEAS
ncbi:MAG: GntR family transcriptional regulator [Anaerolineae bacterium]|nr:GntR family transcriptional regulator [Anaerolineae bacterium]